MNDILINYSADILAHANGMTWTQIARFFRKKGAEYKVYVPYTNTIFPSHLGNRRIGFIENLKAFSYEQQLMMLNELCSQSINVNMTPLKKLLTTHCIRKGFVSRQGTAA